MQAYSQYLRERVLRALDRGERPLSVQALRALAAFHNWYKPIPLHSTSA